jgi:hypothetical protein
MSTSNADPAAVETRVLRAVKQTLTNVIRDTTTPPGMKHPLSAGTIEDIRQCLMLVTARERELAAAAGTPVTLRPHFADEPEASVAVADIGRKKPERGE